MVQRQCDVSVDRKSRGAKSKVTQVRCPCSVRAQPLRALLRNTD